MTTVDDFAESSYRSFHLQANSQDHTKCVPFFGGHFCQLVELTIERPAAPQPVPLRPCRSVYELQDMFYVSQNMFFGHGSWCMAREHVIWPQTVFHGLLNMCYGPRLCSMSHRAMEHVSWAVEHTRWPCSMFSELQNMQTMYNMPHGHEPQSVLHGQTTWSISRGNCSTAMEMFCGPQNMLYDCRTCFMSIEHVLLTIEYALWLQNTFYRHGCFFHGHRLCSTVIEHALWT